jgi:hypothetical protein
MRFYTIILFIVFTNSSFANDSIGEYNINIKLKEISDINITVDAVFDVTLFGTLNDSIVLMNLPFGKNSRLQVIEERTEGESLVYYGFHQNMGKGICILTTKSKKENIKIIFKDVIIPIQEAILFDNSISFTFDFEIQKILNKAFSLNQVIKPNIITIEKANLVYSKPEFKSDLNNKNSFDIDIKNWNEDVFIVLKNRDNSFLSIFLVIFIFNLIIGIVGAPRFVRKKNKTLWALGLSALGTILVGIAFYTLVLPTQFSKDFDVLTGFGLFAGLTIGILIYSIYNILVIVGIEKQTGKKTTTANRVDG